MLINVLSLLESMVQLIILQQKKITLLQENGSSQCSTCGLVQMVVTEDSEPRTGLGDLACGGAVFYHEA